jgi:SPX domain protein involved in polyphosphate accumulation
MNDKRYEIKFVIPYEQVGVVMQWLYSETKLSSSYPDRYVNSLYFDDIYYNAIRDNLAGVSNRRKLRLRWYHDDDEQVISGLVLESKIRDGRLGYKQQFKVNSSASSLFDVKLRDMVDYINDNLNGEEARALLSDDYYISTLQVMYNRAYFEDCNGLRVTFDNNISFRAAHPYDELSKSTIASYPFTVMELKFPLDMKMYVSDLIRSLHYMPKRHSKYLIGMSILNNVVYI